MSRDPSISPAMCMCSALLIWPLMTMPLAMIATPRDSAVAIRPALSTGTSDNGASVLSTVGLVLGESSCGLRSLHILLQYRRRFPDTSQTHVKFSVHSILLDWPLRSCPG